MKIAIIDLGTNTFNIFVAEVFPENTYKKIYKSKISVKLGQGSINSNYIEPEAFRRGISALKTHKLTIDSNGVEKVYAFGTSALRGASNGAEFIQRAREETGIDVKLISGDKEAELIYLGVRQAVTLTETNSLIMDIGGGSTEFIIANSQRIFWKQSFLLGAARLLEKFKPSDPIRASEVLAIEAYLEQELQMLFSASARLAPVELIGSSGSFDSLAEMIAYKFYDIEQLKGRTEYDFRLEDCDKIYRELLASTKEERLKMKGLIRMRVDMIVVSAIFVNFVISRLSLGRMRLSRYALKEGVLWEILHS